MQRKIGFLIGGLLWSMIACQSSDIFQSRGHERAFEERYVQQPWYTAMLIHPYRYDMEYLIDLTGTMAEMEAETMRAPVIVPLGTPLTIVRLDGRHVLARITGHAPLFRIFVQTQRGSLEDVVKELSLVLSKDPPLKSVRPEMQEFIERREITRGMTRREVPMSWGLPDRVNAVPGSSGNLEEWVYFYKRMHVFLDNGMVTNWQQY